MNNWLFILLFILPNLAFAGLVEDFNALDRVQKGPFSLNYLQGPEKRTTINSGIYPSHMQFQAAFRNETARVLSETHGFYVANLFTTNYYELLGEYGYGDAYGSHELDHSLLYAQAPNAMGKASQMVKHWVLEKYYIESNPDSKIAKAFLLRGIAGAEFEAKYAQYFFKFYLYAMNDDFQFLVASLLIQDSPVVDSSGLKKARSVIALLYNEYAEKYGSSHSTVKKIYKIRNIIHNQVSPEAINMIDRFFAEYPNLKKDKRFLNVRANLQAYFSFNIKKIVQQADSLGLVELASAAKTIENSGTAPDLLLQLSRQLAIVKTSLVYDKTIPTKNMDSALALISQASGYLNKELSSGSGVGSKTNIEALCNVIYAEGFLIKDNWEYFLSLIQSGDKSTAKSTMAEIISISSDTLSFAFEPALDQWISINSRMDGFKDSVIKASSLNAAAKNIQ